MIANHTVLVVDNEAGTRESLRWLLKNEYQVRLAENPLAALRTIEEESIDVVFSDILMEPFDGISLLKRIKAMDSSIEVVMMTAFARHESLLGAIRAGATDYLVKPFDKRQVDEVMRKAIGKRSAGVLERRVLKDLQKNVENSYKGSVDSLMQALGAKDIYTYSHSKRVAQIFKVFASRLGFTAQDIEAHKTMAALHDIGKIGIRDAVLKKNGPLTPEEFEEMKLHPKMGYHIVKHLGICEDAIDIVIHHQERYDGAGYPHGLSGTKIPKASRMFAIVDSYDAMRGTRPYRKGLSKETAMAELKKHAGTQFDPALVADFEGMVEQCGGRI